MAPVQKVAVNVLQNLNECMCVWAFTLEPRQIISVNMALVVTIHAGYQLLCSKIQNWHKCALILVTMGDDLQPGCLAGAYQPKVCGCQCTPFANPLETLLSASLFDWSAADWSRPATNKSKSSHIFALQPWTARRWSISAQSFSRYEDNKQTCVGVGA